MTQFNPEVALAQYEKRKRANAGKERVGNACLPAGSPMYYYCRHCGDHTETLPESHVSRPKTACDPCQVLRDHGLV